MDLLKRAIANANKVAGTVFASSFYAWFPSTGSTEKRINCIGAPNTRSDKSVQSGGFLNMPVEEIKIQVKISLFPGMVIPSASSRFYAGSTSNRNTALRYEVKSVHQVAHLSDCVEITGTRAA